MGAVWRDEVDELSPLGELMGAAKDLYDVGARARLGRMFASFVETLDLPPGAMVVPVPPAPGRDEHPVPVFAAEVAAALGSKPVWAVRRRHRTVRLKETRPERRGEVVESAGYEVEGDVSGCHVVLVDDVILSGTTLAHVAGLLRAAGAVSVDAVVVGRTRRAGPDA